MPTFYSEVLFQHEHTRARVTRVCTEHGDFETPVFMPVGTRAGVNNMTPGELLEAQSQIILGGNTYHMLCAPGMEFIIDQGGMHAMMGWTGPMLTDSGGFQVFSLSRQKELCHIDEEGAHFRLQELQGAQGFGDWIHMTPEMSLAAQKIIGADIIMAFDQCTPDASSEAEVKHILERTHRWLLQSYEYQQKNPNAYYGYSQALFGIIQGGIYPHLRRESAEFVTRLPLEGIAIGGETIGFDMKKTVEIVRWIHDLLPENKPRYTMGVGMSPQDLLDVVAEGIDMFDCVAPTRNARHGALYCGKIVKHGQWLKFESEHDQGRIQIKKSCFSDDLNPVMPDCNCYTCQHHTRAYLHHLLKQKSDSFTALASIHNIHVMNQICVTMRQFIKTGEL